MTTDAYAPSAVGERIRELCRQFRLPTLAAETVSRFSERDTRTPSRPLWRCWSRRQRTGTYGGWTG